MKGRRNELTRTLIRGKVLVNAETGCWDCIDVNRTHGYGQIKINYKTWRAHRAAWVAFRGPIPHGLYVLHKCDRPTCCKPAHLYLGNNVANVRDMWLRHRARAVRGSNHARSKLTEKDLPKIVDLVKNQEKTQTWVAEKYGVNPSVISRILSGKVWRHANPITGKPVKPRKYAEGRVS